MKILRIRLENLNSLKGRHEIDLTAEPLASAGLFAITGRTGAGKTTLLDAVTLALYGRAARYGNESNPEHVMSRHCGECSAEVEFEVPSGVYRAVWQRHRAKKKPDGSLQPPKRYIYDEAGTPLAEKIREAEQKIERIIGLDYDRFLRSALLAQGEFARFLKANDNERAELLESLTGTEIYSRLGRLAHTEAVRLENELKEKEAGLEQIGILQKEARKELESAARDGAKQLKMLESEIKSGAEMLKTIERLDGERKNEKRAKDELERIGEDRVAAAKDLECLNAHRSADPFAEDLVRLAAADTAWKAARKNRKRAETEHHSAKADLVRSGVIFRASVEAALALGKREVKEATNAVKNEVDAAAKAGSWLAEHKSDAGLAGQLGDLVAAVGELKNARGSHSRTWTDWRSSAAEILPGEAGKLPESLEPLTHDELETRLDTFLAVAEETKTAMENAGKDAKQQAAFRMDHLENAKLLADLKAHRHKLKDGEPCPLCGAHQHPYAEGAAPEPKIAALEEEFRKASEFLEETRERYKDFSRVLKTMSSGRDPLIDGLRGLAGRVSGLATLLRPLALPVPAPGMEDELRAGLQKREQGYREHLQQKENAEKRKLEARRSADDAKRTTKTLDEKLDDLEEPPAEIDFPLPAAEDLPAVPEAEVSRDEAGREENTASVRLAERRNAENRTEAKSGGTRQSLEARLSGSSFDSIDALRKARLPEENAKKIETLGDELNRRTTATTALQKQAQDAVGSLLKQKTLEGEEAEKFKQHQNESQQQRDELLQEQTRRKTRIETDDGNRNLRRNKEKVLNTARKELAVWRRLRDLIGSHDGSKFRRYAQTISLDILTRHANRHLVRLSDRYQIRRDDDEALDLQIEDLHQAGVRRPMASLSGGESFLVSLALALGLAELAGRTVRIDSLFIDEGFGSLDPETLETAISALESLRQSRKTVGVISHVDLLKERIATRIVVEKLPGGWSRLRIEPELVAGAS